MKSAARALDAPPRKPVSSVTPGSSRQRRRELIRRIELARKSRVLTYVCSDRTGLPAQVAEDAVRPMYDVLHQMGAVDRLDLFLYSRGGATEVPWRIVSMLREHCRRLGALVPFRAHSAATLIALGCDEIVMGPNAELGPIDPAVPRRGVKDGASVTEEDIPVEDVMSYIAFLKDKAEISEGGLSEQMRILSERLSPWVVGRIYRTHAHIRLLAEKLLAAHATPLAEQAVRRIVDALVERSYSHDHAVTRNDAKALGLPIQFADSGLESSMWGLLEEYERMLEMRQPLDADELLDRNVDEAALPQTMAIIEGTDVSWACRGILKLRRIRQAPPEITININFGITRPEHMPQEPKLQEIVDQLARQVKASVPELVRQQLRDQSAVLRVDTRMPRSHWQDVTAEDV